MEDSNLAKQDAHPTVLGTAKSVLAQGVKGVKVVGRAVWQVALGITVPKKEK